MNNYVLQFFPEFLLLLVFGFLPLVFFAVFGEFGPPRSIKITVGGCKGVSKGLKWFENKYWIRFGKHRAMRVTAAANAIGHSLVLPMWPVFLLQYFFNLNKIVLMLFISVFIWMIYIACASGVDLRNRLARRVKKRFDAGRAGSSDFPWQGKKGSDPGKLKFW